MAHLKTFGVELDPFAVGALTEDERSEVHRFIRALDYEKHSGAEHRAAAYLMRLWNAMEYWRNEGGRA